MAPSPTRSGDARWRVLGGVGVELDGGAVDLSPTSRLVLAHLLRRPGRAVAAEEVVAGRGAAVPTVTAGRMAVSRLRAQLAVAGLDAAIGTTAGGYACDTDPMHVDHVAFEAGVRAARAVEWPDAALRRLEEALACWTGPPFGALAGDEPFAADARALEELHRSAVDLWGTLALRAGRHREALPRLEAAVAEEPLREERWVSLVLAHYRAGNQAQALRELEAVRCTLRDEVGVEPGPALQRLAADVLAQAAGLDWRPEAQRPRPANLRSLSGPSVLLGREREVDDVLALVERHRVVTIVGFGGIGKTTLAIEVATRGDRPAWFTSLADVHEPARLPGAVAAAMGIVQESGDPLALAIDHLDASGGLLVLDNCEHVHDAVVGVIDRLVQGAPSGRVLATSRVELDVPRAMRYPLGPLDLGAPGEPGPGAVMVADHAMIPPSQLAEQWEVVSAIWRQSDGVPLAIELLGAATAAGAVVPTSPRAAVDDAVEIAVESLPDEARAVVRLLVALPADASVAFLHEVIGRSTDELRRALGFGIRAGLVVQQAVTAATRVRVLQPAREVLTDRLVPPPTVLTDVHAAVQRLAHVARPRLIGGIDPATVALLDDEHETVRWLLAQLDDEARFRLVLPLASVWRAVGRTLEGQALLTGVGHVASTAPPPLRARWMVAVAQISPSLAARVPHIDDLRSAMAIADEHGDDDLYGRAGAELAIGLGWSGALAEASAVIDAIEARCKPPDRWAEVTLASLRAMAGGAGGDVVGAARTLAALAEEFRAAGTSGDVLSNLYMALFFARIAGDDELISSILAAGEHVPRDRFGAYSRAAFLFERARLAARDGGDEAGPMLWDAFGELRSHGEHRTLEVCRRELGVWRLAHGDDGGIADLAHSAVLLCTLDPAAAAIAVAHLSTALAADGQAAAAATLSAASDMLLGLPGGIAPSGMERAALDERPAPASTPPTLGELEALLRSVESDAHG